MAPRAPPTTIFCGWLTSHGKIAGVRYFEKSLLALPDLGWSSTFAIDELNFCVLPLSASGTPSAEQRSARAEWEQVYPKAIITGMAPLVGLEAEGDFEKGLKMSLF